MQANAIPARAPITDPLMANLRVKMDRARGAGPFELPGAMKDLCDAFLSVVVEDRGRISELERKLRELETEPDAAPGVVL